MDASGFDFLFQSLSAEKRRRLVIANGVDKHSLEAAYKARSMNLVEVLLTGSRDTIAGVCRQWGFGDDWYSVWDCGDEQEAIDRAVRMCRDKEADLIMKGMVSTDRFMRAILSKEQGLLPPGALLSHVTVLRNQQYGKPLIVSDVAIIPLPTLEQ
nr:hypothetical protein [Prolixibacteraceae bacterium]